MRRIALKHGTLQRKIPRQTVRKLQARVPEQIGHEAIAQFLAVALPADAVSFAVDSAGKATRTVVRRSNDGGAKTVRVSSTAAKLKRRGGKPGIPDHYVFWNHITCWMEVKRLVGGVLSVHQREMGQNLQANGAHWFVVRTIEDVEAGLRHAGIPLRPVGIFR